MKFYVKFPGFDGILHLPNICLYFARFSLTYWKGYRYLNSIISLVIKNFNIDVVSSPFSFYTYFLSALKNVWNSMKI